MADSKGKTHTPLVKPALLRYYRTRKETDVARKGQKASTRREVTLEKIEEHLKEQDKEARQSIWLTFAAFGGSVALLGVAVWLGSITNVTVLDYAVLITLGVVLMVTALVQSSRIAARKVCDLELNRTNGIKSKYNPLNRRWSVNTIFLFIVFGIIIILLIILAFKQEISAEYTRLVRTGYITEIIAGILALVAAYMATNKYNVRWLIMLAILFFLIGRWIQLGNLF
jgi:hypothetical protein